MTAIITYKYSFDFNIKFDANFIYPTDMICRYSDEEKHICINT